MNLGDVLSAHFRLKAVLIRVKLGLVVAVIYLLVALFCLFTRIAFGLYILVAVNAPQWLWVIWIVHIPAMFLVEQIEKSR